jgi:catechol 2,3-dioxygenase-like lactoylglutathione lyase family enzyme
MTNSTARPFNQPRLEHIAIWARDLDASAAFLHDVLGWRRHPMAFGVPEDNPVFGGMDLAFVDANGLWIELVQPTTEGPGQEFLDQKGDGAIVELDFEIDDFEANLDAYRQRGIELIGMDGKPLYDGGLLQEWVLTDGKRVPADEHLSYLPFDLARGTSIELFTEEPNGAVIVRDATWTDAQRTPASAPRLDHVVLIAADLEATSRVYTDIMGLAPLPARPGIHRGWLGAGKQHHAWIDANGRGLALEIVQPAAGSEALSALGDGTILELAVRVADLDAFAASLRSKGLQPSSGEDALPAGTAALTDPETGHRYFYLPQAQCHGMRILMFEGAPRT